MRLRASVLALVSLLTATTLTFTLAPVYIGALFGTAVAVWQITGDGEATLFEGAALVATFGILAIVAAFAPCYPHVNVRFPNEHADR